MKKIVTIFVGCLSCSSAFGALPPSSTLVSSQKSTVVSVTQDRATATAPVTFDPTITINTIQNQVTKETDPDKLDALIRELQELRKFKQEQLEYQKAQDAEAKAKAEAEAKARREAERKAKIEADRRKREYDNALRKFMNCKRIVEEASSGKLSRPYNPYGSELDRINMNQELKNKRESKESAIREAEALSLKWGFQMFDTKEKKHRW